MVAFLLGASSALLLAVATFFALEYGTVTSIERIENPSVKLDGVDHQYSPMSGAESD